MPSTPARILVVDDNPPTLYSTSRVLERAGWFVIQAASGLDALRKAEETIDLVILDINLPDIHGFEVCRRIRTIESRGHVPVIHLSASFTRDDDRVQGLEAGADGYLTHPVEPLVLVATVKAYLRMREVEHERERLLVSERQARAAAERANQIKDQFLATLSHELRTPLNSIVGWSQLLRLGGLTDAEVAQGIDTIERNAKAQAQLISDLLDVSRITSGKFRLELEDMKPAAMVEDALRSILPTAEEKQIRVITSIDPQAGPLRADPGRLQQVVWNLVNNAVKFTPAGGEIRVELKQAGSQVRFTVTDNGHGIPNDLLIDIFEWFKQGDSTTTRRHSGLGLGLGICKQIVEYHGGTIRAESDGEGRGAQFLVELPVSTENVNGVTAPVRHEDASGSARLSGITVLVVEDDQDSRELVQRILMRCDANVALAHSVSHALQQIDSVNPDLLISDLSMPGEDGYSLIQAVRANPKHANLPAIALTAFAHSDDVARVLGAGFNVHLAKPIDSGRLTSTAARAVGR